MRMKLWRLFAAAFVCSAMTGCVTVADFSPDGTHIATMTGEGLGIMKADGTGFRPIPSGKEGYAPRWSPDGKQIAFLAGKLDMAELMLYDAASQKTIRLGSEYTAPIVWREDGKRLAAIHVMEDEKQEIVFYNLPEKGITLRVPLEDVGVAPSMNDAIYWLPATDDVAFLGVGQNLTNVYTAERGEVKQITTSNDVIGLGLTPDGKKLIWARRGPNLRYILLSLYAYDLKNRTVERLPFPERIPALNPNPRKAPDSVDYVSFSPDGNHLALHITLRAGKRKGSEKMAQYGACYSVKMDGSEARLIRQTKTFSDAKSQQMLISSWSRDGKKICLADFDDRKMTLVTFNTDGSGGKRLFTHTLPE